MKLPVAASFILLMALGAQAQSGGAAAISASPAPLGFAARSGSNPGAVSLTVSTADPVAMWSATVSAPWLSVSPSLGTGPSVVSVSADPSNLLPGFYTATVQITSGGTTNSVPVTMAVSAAPDKPIVTGNQWFVAPSGTPEGDGTVNRPWDIGTGLNNKTVQPGDIVWLRGGHYEDGAASAILQSRLVGTPGAPIIVRAYRDERVILDAWLQVGCCDQSNDPAQGSYTWFWGLEMAGFNPDRTSTAAGQQSNHAGGDAWGDGTRFINCIVHDTSGGVSLWNTNGSEVYGSIFYNIGGYGPDRGHGHDLYLQNTGPGFLNVADNIAFNSFDEGIQAYGGHTADVQNMTFAGNIVFNSGVLDGTLVDNFTIGGSSDGPGGIVLDGNYTYDTPDRNLGQNELGYLWTPVSHDAVITNNYFIGGYQAVDLERWNTLTFRNNTMYVTAGSQQSWLIYGQQNPANYNYGNNTYYGAGQFWIFAGCDNWPCPNGYQSVESSQWQQTDGLDQGSTFQPGEPAGAWTFVRPNLYEPGRANIVIYNWGLQPAVSVDLSRSGISPGDPYVIRDAENWFGPPVASGTYSGQAVSIPMSGLTVAPPVGSVPFPPAHTAPQFGAFVLLSGNAYPRGSGGFPPVGNRR